jgi:transposase
MQRFGLRDAMGTDQDFLPGRQGHVGGNAAVNRLFVDAVLYRYRTGTPWRDLPARFGHWKIVHQRFGRWARSGVFDRLFKSLASDPDNEYMMMIDATIVRAHQHSAGARKKTARKRAAPASAHPIVRRADAPRIPRRLSTLTSVLNSQGLPGAGLQ